MDFWRSPKLGGLKSTDCGWKPSKYGWFTIVSRPHSTNPGPLNSEPFPTSNLAELKKKPAGLLLLVPRSPQRLYQWIPDANSSDTSLLPLSAQNILVLTSLSLHLHFLMSISTFPRLHLPLSPLTHSFAILLFLNDSNFESKLRLSKQSFYMALNLWFTLQHKSLKPIVSTIRRSGKFFKLKVLMTIVSLVPPTLLAPMNTSSLSLSLSLTLFSHHVFRIPSSMRISDSRIKYLGHILRHPESPKSF